MGSAPPRVSQGLQLADELALALDPVFGWAELEGIAGRNVIA